jgi:CheY-like chemotaxis protein
MRALPLSPGKHDWTRSMSSATDSQDDAELRPRILLVDDENFIRDSLYTILERAGYEVLAASNGPDGLTIFRQSRPPIDLLVTDYNMPQMSGLELARECLKLRCELSVLFVSGCRPDEELQAELQARKRGFLAKPFRGAELLHKTRELLLAESTVRPYPAH